MSVFDSASFNDDLLRTYGLDTASDYFGRVSRLKTLLKKAVSDRARLPHHLFLCANASTGFMAIAGGLSASGQLPGRLIGTPYPGFADVLALLSANANPMVGFATHISPVTGAVVDLETTVCNLLIVDAAQSLGTILQEELRTAPIVIAGLQKHLGIGAGLGIIGLQQLLLPEELFNRLRLVAALVENGCVDLTGLERAVQRVSNGTQADNKARVFVGDRIAKTCEAVGLRVVTPKGLQAHIVAVSPIENDAKVHDVVDTARTGGRVIQAGKVLRFSIDSRLDGLRTPKEYEELVCERIRDGSRIRNTRGLSSGLLLK